MCAANITIEDVYKALLNFNETLTKKIDGVETEIKKLTNKINSEISEAKHKINKIESENIVLKNRLKAVERKIKNKNLIFYGIQEKVNETYIELIEEIGKIVIENLQITGFGSHEITNIFRLGKKSDRSRPILVEISSILTRNNIISNRTKLKGLNIFISEDLIKEDREERKVLIEATREAKGANKQAYLKGKNLIIEGLSYSYADVQEKKHLSTLEHYPPPALRRIEHEIENVEQNLQELEDESGQQSEGQETHKGSEEEKKRKLELSPGKASGTKPKKTNFTGSQRILSRNRVQ